MWHNSMDMLVFEHLTEWLGGPCPSHVTKCLAHAKEIVITHSQLLRVMTSSVENKTNTDVTPSTCSLTESTSLYSRPGYSLP
jgi:uncharacterized protein YcfL